MNTSGFTSCLVQNNAGKTLMHGGVGNSGELIQHRYASYTHRVVAGPDHSVITSRNRVPVRQGSADTNLGGTSQVV